MARCESSHDEAAETLARAYEALDRRALAIVVRSHQAHRDLTNIHLTVR